MIKPLMIKITPLNDDAESCKKLEAFIKPRYETSLLASDDENGKYLLPIDVKDDVLANLSSVSGIIIVDRVEYDVNTQTELSETNLYAPGEGLSEDAGQVDDAQVNFDSFADDSLDALDIGNTASVAEEPASQPAAQETVGAVENVKRAEVLQTPAPIERTPITIDPSAEDDGIGVMPELRPFSVSDVMAGVKDLLIPIESADTMPDPVMSMETVEDDDDSLEPDDDERHHISLQSMTLIPDQTSMLDELTSPLSVEFAEPNIQLDMLRQQCEMMWNSNISMHQSDIQVLFSSDLTEELDTLREIAQNDPNVDRFEDANKAYIRLQEKMESDLDEIYAKYENDLKAWLDEQIKLLEAKYREERPDTETDAAAAAFIAEATPILKQESDKLISLRSKAQNQIIYAAMRDSQKSGAQYTPILSALSCIAFKHNMEDILYNAERSMTASMQQQAMAQPVQPPMATMSQAMGQMAQLTSQPQQFVAQQPIEQPTIQPMYEPQPQTYADPSSTAVIAPIIDDDPFEPEQFDSIDDKLAHSQHAKTEPEFEPIEFDDGLPEFDTAPNDGFGSSTIDQQSTDFDNLPSLFAEADPSEEATDFDDGLGDLGSLGDLDLSNSSIDSSKVELNKSSDGLGLDPDFDLDDMLDDLDKSSNTQMPGAQNGSQQEPQFDPDAKPPKKKMSLVKKIAIAGAGVVLAGGIACGAMLFLSQPAATNDQSGEQSQSQTGQSSDAAKRQQEIAAKFAKGDKLRVGVGGQLTDVLITDSNEYGMIVEDAAQNQYQLTWDQLQSYIDAHPEEFTESGKTDAGATGEDQTGKDQSGAATAPEDEAAGSAAGSEPPANTPATDQPAASDPAANDPTAAPATQDEPASNDNALTTEEVKAASTGGGTEVAYY